jgi:signal transduction histidine kinase
MRRIGLLLWPAALALGLTAEWVAFGWSQPRQWVPDLAVGWTFIGCGLIASARRPESHSGALMAATGFAWFIGNFAAVDVDPVAWAAAQGIYLHRGPLVHLILAYPGGRLPSRPSRTAVVAGYAAAVVAPVWDSEIPAIVLAVLVVAVLARDYLRAVGRNRRARAFSVWAAAGFGLVVAGGAAARLALPPADVVVPSLLAYEVVLASIAVGLFAGLLAAPWDRAAVTDLVVELGEVRAGTLRGELSRALGDPSVEVGYWVAGAEAFLDTEGRELRLPDPDSGRAVTLVRRGEEPVAAIVHDPAVLNDPGLVEAITSAAQLAASNARLQAELQRRVAELAASGRRILEAGDEERQRLEGRLREGAERRLEGLAETLRRGRLSAPGEVTKDRIARAEDQLTRTLEDLRRLARGLHPHVLSEHGLEGALAALAQDFPVPIEIQVSGSRVETQIEIVAYFVCAEALANVAKHASASRVTVSVAAVGGRVRVQIQDDGVGGADPAHGSGLRGLGDRVETVGGTLQVESVPGGGTRLTAEIPLGGEAR